MLSFFFLKYHTLRRVMVLIEFFFAQILEVALCSDFNCLSFIHYVVLWDFIGRCIVLLVAWNFEKKTWSAGFNRANFFLLNF